MESLFLENKNLVWYNLQNPNESVVQDYLKKFELTSYTLQDAVEKGHLPKFEHQENFDFVLVRFYKKEKRSSSNVIRGFSHKIGIFIGSNFILTIHQNEVPFWDLIKADIEKDKNKEGLTPQKIFYKIVKNTLESYLAPSDKIAQQIESYEDLLFVKESEIKFNLKRLYELKRESSSCTKLLILTHDVLKEHRNYTKSNASVKDLIELNMKLLHLHSQNTEDLQSLFTLTLSISDQRSNEIMKVLTIFSAFFLPLTFITGFYGMNFDYIPGLHSQASFLGLVFLMLVIVIVIFIWFKRKRFL